MSTLKARLQAARQEKRGLASRVLPLVAFYGREPTLERRRGEFYAAMAKAYGWAEWKQRPGKKEREIGGEPGREGRPAHITRIGIDQAFPVDTNAAPLEFLYTKGLLQTRNDAHGSAYRRLSAGLRFRNLLEGSEICGLRAASFEGAGGGSSTGLQPGEYKMECIRFLSVMRGPESAGGMPADLLSLLEDVVYFDRWTWEGRKGKQRDIMFDEIRKALDRVSVPLRLMTRSGFDQRWHRPAPRA
ncbi:hypothetical protein HHL25_02980 [Rhizobium sp. S-51]|uniref:Uncharacterized protein n=1 Tax=Rhizobium terricola TaxID=2728849 RepID=A0A7Y0ATB4_9HYPH|nr:hypothetical protein [Rhizobium terricola]NML73083.1 hypothetical protein [Rhizobium terricola]